MCYGKGENAVGRRMIYERERAILGKRGRMKKESVPALVRVAESRQQQHREENYSRTVTKYPV